MVQEEADEPPELKSSTGFLLARLGAESRRRWARLLSERGLTPYHFGVLMALGQGGETHQQRLSTAIGVDPRNAVPIFDTLEARKLITRTSDQTDRRKRTVTITAAGRATVEELRRTGATLDHDLLAGLTDNQRTTLHRLLLKVFDTTMDTNPTTTTVPAKPADRSTANFAETGQSVTESDSFLRTAPNPVPTTAGRSQRRPDGTLVPRNDRRGTRQGLATDT